MRVMYLLPAGRCTSTHRPRVTAITAIWHVMEKGTGKHGEAQHCFPYASPLARDRSAGAMKLTTAAVAALAMPPGKSDHIEWDADLPGFGIRIRNGPDRTSYGLVRTPRPSAISPRIGRRSASVLLPTSPAPRL